MIIFLCVAFVRIEKTQIKPQNIVNVRLFPHVHCLKQA